MTKQIVETTGKFKTLGINARRPRCHQAHRAQARVRRQDKDQIPQWFNTSKTAPSVKLNAIGADIQINLIPPPPPPSPQNRIASRRGPNRSAFASPPNPFMDPTMNLARSIQDGNTQSAPPDQAWRQPNLRITPMTINSIYCFVETTELEVSDQRHIEQQNRLTASQSQRDGSGTDIITPTEFHLIVISRTQHDGMPPDRAKILCGASS